MSLYFCIDSQQWLAIHVSIDSFCKKADNCGYNNYVLYQINYEIDSKFLKLISLPETVYL